MICTCISSKTSSSIRRASSSTRITTTRHLNFSSRPSPHPTPKTSTSFIAPPLPNQKKSLAHSIAPLPVHSSPAERERQIQQRLCPNAPQKTTTTTTVSSRTPPSLNRVARNRKHRRPPPPALERAMAPSQAVARWERTASTGRSVNQPLYTSLPS